MILFRSFFVGIIIFSVILASGQGTNTYFGNSPVQYKKHEWKFISTDNFDAYYYGDNHDLAEYSLKAAESHLKGLENLIDYRLGGRSQILIYNNTADLQQSNQLHSDLPFNPGGYTYGIENKVILYFDGNKFSLDRQLRYGISQMLVNELMYGGSFQEKIQASTLLYLPEWFYKGLLSYLSNPWDTRIDSKVKDAFATKSFHRISLLSPDEAIIAGHSWWNFIAEKYGKKNISDILYLTRVSKSYENALIFVLGETMRSIFQEWINFYELEYADDPGNNPGRDARELPSRLHGKKIINVKLSPNGLFALLSTEDHGKSEIWLTNLSDNTTKRLFKQDFKTNVSLDYVTEPIISWTPEGRSFYAFLHQKGHLHMLHISIEGKVISNTRIKGLDGVSWADHHPQEDRLVISGFAGGNSDIFLIGTKQHELYNITNDIFDDLYPSFEESGNKIYFSSNRTNNLLPGKKHEIVLLDDTSNFDIYMIETGKINEPMKRITSTDYINEIQPKEYFNQTLSYLSDNNGIYNLYVSKYAYDFDQADINVYWKDKTQQPLVIPVNKLIYSDSVELWRYLADSSLIDSVERFSVISHFRETYRHYPLSNYSRNILLSDISLIKQKELTLIRYNGKYYLNILDISTSIEEDATYNAVTPTSFRRRTGYQAFVPDSNINTALVPHIKPDDKPVPDSLAANDSLNRETAPYFFQSGFPDLPSVSRFLNEKEKDIQVNTKARDYKLNFFPDYFVTQLLDNSVINTYFYENNAHTGLMNGTRQISARVEASMSDVFKDHSIKVGGRLPLGFNGTDFYLDYQNRRYKNDFGVIFFRQSRLGETNREYNRVFLHEVRPYFIVPLVNSLNLRFSGFYREDRSLTLSTDPVSAVKADNINRWAGGKAEIIYDRSVMEALNFPTGIRFKAFIEIFNNTTRSGSSTNVVGMDLRWYKKIHRKIVWANRLSLNGSFGPSRILYNVGGTENWLKNAVNENLGVNTLYNYSLVSLGNGIRGFSRNIRNGSNYLVLNSEIRLPIVSYLSKVPVSYDLLRNIQLIGFYDIGSAWNGWSPFGDQHYNTRVVDQGSVKVTVRNRNNPFVSGFGTGIRSRIFGYYFRCDLAWGIENGIISDKIWMFSLGYDF